MRIPLYTSGTSWVVKVVFSINGMFMSYPHNGCVVFGCLCRMISAMLSIERQQLDQSTVSDWKKHHLIIGDLTRQINNIFGLFTLTVITSIFVLAVNWSFNLLQNTYNSDQNLTVDTWDKILPLWVVLKATAYLILLARESQLIRQEVNLNNSIN